MRGRLAVALLLVASLAFAAHATRYLDHQNDDAYITFRYARFLALGRGPYFNPGEHVEGYTNFLLMLLSSLVFAAGGEAAVPPAAKAIGIVSGLACVAASFVLARRLLGPALGDRAAQVGAATAALLLAGAESFALNATSGLETTLFAALVAVGVLLGMASLETGRWRGSGLAFAAACLTRPEGPLLAGGFWVGAALVAARGGAGRDTRATLRALAWDAVSLAVVVGGHLAFRIAAYDGEWLPNTFYAKIGGSGVVPTRAYIQAGTLLPFLGWAGAAVAAAGLGIEKRLWWSACPLVTTAGLAALLPVFTGTDWMPGWRLVVPGLPLVAVLVAVGWTVCLARLERYARGALLVLPLLAIPAWWSQAEARGVFRTVLDARARGVETALRPLAL